MTASQKFPGLIEIRAHEGAFILKKDSVAMYYKNFENLAKDIKPGIRQEFRLDDPEAILGSC